MFAIFFFRLCPSPPRSRQNGDRLEAPKFGAAPKFFPVFGMVNRFCNVITVPGSGSWSPSGWAWCTTTPPSSRSSTPLPGNHQYIDITVDSLQDPDPDSRVFWIRIRNPDLGLKKRYKMLNHHKIIYFLYHFICHVTSFDEKIL